MLIHPLSPCHLHFLLFGLPCRGIGFRPIRHDRNGDEVQDEKLLFGRIGHAASLRMAGWLKSPEDERTRRLPTSAKRLFIMLADFGESSPDCHRNRFGTITTLSPKNRRTRGYAPECC